MRKHTLAILMAGLTTALLAHAGSLKSDMKALGGLFKQIQASVSDRGQNAANAANTDKMIALFRDVRGQEPDNVASLPPAQKHAAMADYQRIIDQEIALCTELKAAFLANDNTAAAGAVNKMNLGKREGHDKYK